jgi:hypothetical protein
VHRGHSSCQSERADPGLLSSPEQSRFVGSEAASHSQSCICRAGVIAKPLTATFAPRRYNCGPRCSRTPTPPKNGSRKMIPKASLSSMRSWSEPHRAPNYPCHAADRGLGDPVEFVASIICQQGTGIGVSLALASGIRNQNSPFERILRPGCRARSLTLQLPFFEMVALSDRLVNSAPV